MPLFSVVIPAYNRESTIKRAIESVLVQTIDDFEVIAVDDGSQDNTATLVASFTDPRVRLVRYPNNKGQIHATNVGIYEAQGKYVSFLDSDDAYLPETLANQLEAYKQDDEVGVVYGYLDAITPEGTIYPWPRSDLEGYIYTDVLKRGYLCGGPALSAKKECLDAIWPLDTIFTIGCRDDELCFQLSRLYKVGLIKKTVAYVYTDADNRITNQKRAKKGWLFLFLKHAADIMEKCGQETLAFHYMRCCHMFTQLGNKDSNNFALQSVGLTLSLYFSWYAFAIFLMLKVFPKGKFKQKALKKLFKKYFKINERN